MARTHTRTPAVRLARWRGNIAAIAQSLSSAKAADACDLSSNFVFWCFRCNSTTKRLENMLHYKFVGAAHPAQGEYQAKSKYSVLMPFYF